MAFNFVLLCDCDTAVFCYLRAAGVYFQNINHIKSLCLKLPSGFLSQVDSNPNLLWLQTPHSLSPAYLQPQLRSLLLQPLALLLFCNHTKLISTPGPCNMFFPMCGSPLYISHSGFHSNFTFQETLPDHPSQRHLTLSCFLPITCFVFLIVLKAAGVICSLVPCPSPQLEWRLCMCRQGLSCLVQLATVFLILPTLLHTLPE